jgi:uncharacterized protein (TIGR03435 family)
VFALATSRERTPARRLGSLRYIDGTADELCHTLEAQLDRPVVNETSLKGEFEFHVESAKAARNKFLEHLHDQLGVDIKSAQRNVEVLMFDLN